MILYCITVKHTCSKFEELEIEIDSALHSAGRCWEVRFDNMMIEMVRVDPWLGDVWHHREVIFQTLWYSNVVILWYCNVVILWYCNKKILWSKLMYPWLWMSGIIGKLSFKLCHQRRLVATLQVILLVNTLYHLIAVLLLRWSDDDQTIRGQIYLWGSRTDL